MNKYGKKFEELMEVVAKLRAPDGCMWDKEQTHESITLGFVEELYEFIEAVEDKDLKTMKEELGDLCLHVVFQVQIAREENEFDIAKFEEMNLIRKARANEKAPVKILANNIENFDKKVTIRANAFSKTAKEIIEKLGGKAEVI